MLLQPLPSAPIDDFDADHDESLPRAPVTSDQLMAHARELAALHGQPGLGGRNRLLRWLDRNATQLEQIVDELAAGLRAGRRLPPAAMWLIDNRPLIRGQIATVRRH